MAESLSDWPASVSAGTPGEKLRLGRPDCSRCCTQGRVFETTEDVLQQSLLVAQGLALLLDGPALLEPVFTKVPQTIEFGHLISRRFLYSSVCCISGASACLHQRS